MRDTAITHSSAAIGWHLVKKKTPALYPCSVQEVIGPRSDNDLGLLLQVEVLPGVLGVDVVFVHLQNFVVADSPGVGVVHDTCEGLAFCKWAAATPSKTPTTAAKTVG